MRFPLPLTKAFLIAPLLVCVAGIGSCGSSSRAYAHRSVQRQVLLVHDSLGRLDSIGEQSDSQSAYIVSEGELVLWVQTAKYGVRAIFKGFPRVGDSLQTKNVWVMDKSKPTDTIESGDMQDGHGRITGIPFSLPESLVQSEVMGIGYERIAWKKSFTFSIFWRGHRLTGESHMIQMIIHQPNLAD